MTETVYLHVGAPKSGTTSLQAVLEENVAVLADAGVLVVGERHADRVQAALQVREDPRWAQLPEHRRDMWGRLVEQIRSWSGPSAILSYELFSAASAEQAERVLEDLADFDVHVVITARDLARSLPSAWQERLKFGVTTPLEKWRPPTAEAEGTEWGWRTLDPARVAERWGSTLRPDRVHVVTVPRRPSEDSLWERFAAACDIADVPVVGHSSHANPSLGAVEAELLRRVNGYLRPPLEGSRERAVWLRDMLANQILAIREDRSPIGVTDELYAEAVERADTAIAQLHERGYVVHGDLEDLRATRPEGRLPADVPDAEVLGAALRTIVDLLVELRSRSVKSREQSAPSAPGGPRNAGRRLVQRVAAPYVKRRDASLRERMAELEKQVMQARELHLRVATLHDLVTELLVPADARNRELTADAIRRYRKESL